MEFEFASTALGRPEVEQHNFPPIVGHLLIGSRTISQLKCRSGLAAGLRHNRGMSALLSKGARGAENQS